MISNVAIIYVEFVNRTSPGSWIDALPRTAIPIILAQWCLWRAFSGAPHWMLGWAFFTVGNAVMRCGAIALIGTEADQVGNWWIVTAGVAGMILCSFIVKRGLTG